MSTDLTTAANLISGFEGYSSKAYWDVNHYRVGYGSDTEGPDQVNVVASTVTTKARAMQNLMARIPQYQNLIIAKIGRDTWGKLNVNQQAALTSLTYNYGHLPVRVYLDDPQKTANAISALKGANGGVNSKRRVSEAAFYLKPVNTAPVISTSAATAVSTASSAALQYFNFNPVFVLIGIGISVALGVVLLFITRPKPIAAVPVTPIEKLNEMLNDRADLDEQITGIWVQIEKDFGETQNRISAVLTVGENANAQTVPHQPGA